MIEVKLSALLRTLRATLWRQEPVIYPERLKHSVDAEGRHHLELVLEAGEVEDDLPTWVGRPVAGLSTASAGKKADND
ncbi:MAG TPA: hypothetical protein VEK07_08905 [Polyangiaceae bacterium]|nr:hypothetical protein [Polyangiaceae bacterium]